jgi:hypothetical protein
MYFLPRSILPASGLSKEAKMSGNGGSPTPKVWESPELQSWSHLYKELDSARDALVLAAEMKVDNPHEAPSGTEHVDEAPEQKGPGHTDDSLSHQILRTEFMHSGIAVKSARRSHALWKFGRLLVGGAAVLIILFLAGRISMDMIDGTFDPVFWREGVAILGLLFTGALMPVIINGVKDADESYKAALGMNKELFQRVQEHEFKFGHSIGHRRAG